MNTCIYEDYFVYYFSKQNVLFRMFVWVVYAKILTVSMVFYRANDRPDSPGNHSTLSGIEVQLMNMFQRDFLALLGTFK